MHVNTNYKEKKKELVNGDRKKDYKINKWLNEYTLLFIY